MSPQLLELTWRCTLNFVTYENFQELLKNIKQLSDTTLEIAKNDGQWKVGDFQFRRFLIFLKMKSFFNIYLNKPLFKNCFEISYFSI